MKKIYLLQVVLGSYGSLFSQNKNLPLQIVPSVKEWKIQAGKFILVFSKSLPITTGARKEGDICFELKQILKKQEGTYSIKIDEKIIVEAADYTGIWNAMQTLLQMLVLNKNDLSLPAGTIKDYPFVSRPGHDVGCGEKIFSFQYFEAIHSLYGVFKI